MKIGLLITVALVILMVTIFSLGAEQRFWERKVQYEIHFTRTGGLQVGSQVSLNGVPIGSGALRRGVTTWYTGPVSATSSGLKPAPTVPRPSSCMRMTCAVPPTRCESRPSHNAIRIWLCWTRYLPR